MLPYLEDDLAGLAEHARRTSRLADAATVRARADRRRRHRRLAAGAAGVLLAAGLGLGSTLAGRDTAPVLPAGPSVSEPLPALPVPPPVLDLLDGGRALAVVPIVDGQPIPRQQLSVTPTGRLDVATKAGAPTLFVPDRIMPGKPLFLMRTGTLDPDGRPECLVVKLSDAPPQVLTATVCDPSKPSQQFAFDPAGPGTFRISVGGLYLSWHPKDAAGLTASGASTTVFALLDQGERTPPGR